MAFDLDCHLEEYDKSATMIFLFNKIELPILVTRSHEVKKVVPIFSPASISTFTVNQYPDNVYTQIIAKHIKLTPLNKQLIDSFANWDDVLQKQLNIAIKSIPFAEICYYCP